LEHYIITVNETLDCCTVAHSLGLQSANLLPTCGAKPLPVALSCGRFRSSEMLEANSNYYGIRLTDFLQRDTLGEETSIGDVIELLELGPLASCHLRFALLPRVEDARRVTAIHGIPGLGLLFLAGTIEKTFSFTVASSSLTLCVRELSSTQSQEVCLRIGERVELLVQRIRIVLDLKGNNLSNRRKEHAKLTYA
jgi:hypothetical protein